jgi:hypothetical protein
VTTPHASGFLRTIHEHLPSCFSWQCPYDGLGRAVFRAMTLQSVSSASRPPSLRTTQCWVSAIFPPTPLLVPVPGKPGWSRHARFSCIVCPSRHIMLALSVVFYPAASVQRAKHLTRPEGFSTSLPNIHPAPEILARGSRSCHAVPWTGRGAWSECRSSRHINYDDLLWFFSFVSSSTHHFSLQDSGPSSSSVVHSEVSPNIKNNSRTPN